MLFLKCGFGKLRSKKLAGLLLLTIMISSCVTTTTGGFMVDASEDQAAVDYIQLALAYFDNNDMPGARRHVTTLSLSMIESLMPIWCWR